MKKKVKKTKHSELEKILLSCENGLEETNKNIESFSKNKEIFSHEWEFLNNYFNDEKLVHFIKFPEISEQFKFINCRVPKISKDQLYDQVYN